MSSPIGFDGLIGSASSSGSKRPYSELNNRGSQVQGSAPSTEQKVLDVVARMKRSSSESDLPAIAPLAPKKMKRVVGLSDMPKDMILEVIKYLPLDSLMRFARVSKNARKYAYEILKNPTYFIHAIPKIEPRFLLSSLSLLFKQTKEWSKSELLNVARVFSTALEWQTPALKLLASVDQKDFWDPELVRVQTPNPEKNYLSIKLSYPSPILTTDPQPNGLLNVIVKIHLMLIKRFFGGSQKIESDNISKEQLEFLLSQLPYLEDEWAGLGVKLSPELGHVLSNVNLYFNFAPPEILVLLLDFVKKKCLHLPPQLFTEFDKIDSPDRRKTCFDVLFNHPHLLSLCSYLVKGDGSQMAVMKSRGIFYSDQGRLSGTGSLKNSIGDNFEGEFQDGKLFSGKGVLTDFDSFQKFSGAFKNGKPEGEVEITDGRGKQFSGSYIDGFPWEGKGEVRDALGRIFDFGKFQKVKPTRLRKVTFQNGDTCTGPFSGRAGGRDQTKIGEMGTYQFADRSTYTGSLRDFRPNGNGKKIYTDGDFEEGEFKDAVFLNGHVSITYENDDKYVGEWKDGMENGQGTLKYADGIVYIGGFENNEQSGHGTLTFTSGAIYEGEFRQGKFNGQGTFKYNDGGVYIGNFEKGMRSGHGILTFPDGAIYEGEFKERELSGQGTLKYADGRVYIGGFEHNEPSGHGTLTFPNGAIYKGEFKDGKYSGQGTLKHADDSVYIGGFENGERSGQGTLAFPNGASYKGEFKDGKYSGQGTFKHADGRVYIGGFENGERSGKGTLRYSDNFLYEGAFRNNRRHGQGTLKYSDGRVYIGEFENGQRSGYGTVTFPDGSFYEGEFKNDKSHGQGTTHSFDGIVFKGCFLDGKQNGPGSHSFPDGYKYEGTWTDGKKNGPFKRTSPDGELSEVVFQDDNPFDGVFRNYNPDGTFVLEKYVKGEQVPLNDDVAG